MENSLGQRTPYDTYWICDIKSSQADIYRHMSIEHGCFYTIEEN